MVQRCVCGCVCVHARACILLCQQILDQKFREVSFLNLDLLFMMIYKIIIDFKKKIQNSNKEVTRATLHKS